MAARKRVHWMNEKDDVILEALNYLHPVAIGPTPLHWNIENRLSAELSYEARTGGGFSLDTLRNRVDKLSKLGLLEITREKGSYLSITKEGKEYLVGKLDASDLETGNNS